MKKLLLPILGLVLLISISSCKKDEETTTPTPKKTNYELLVGKGWVVSSATSSTPIDWNDDGNRSTDIYAQMDACDKDDFTTYNVNNTYITDEGATKCDPGDPQTWSGIWLLSSDQTTLNQDGESAIIKGITETTLSLEYTYVSGVTYIMTYVKK